MIAKEKLTALSLDSRYELAGSSGVIGYKPNVDKLFGMPIKLTAGGMGCDLIDTNMVATLERDGEKYIQTNKSLGVIGSSLEHLVLEQLFATNGEQGFSAVKAIQVANQEGQKIFTITQDNYQEIIPQLNLAPAAIADIESAAKAGYTVTTHQNRISLNGYTGEGYIILDSSGNGAWMINGGMYGGFLNLGASLLLAGTVALGTQAIADTTYKILFPSFVSSIVSGLGLASNFLDLMALYDGTADCYYKIVIAFALEVWMVLMTLTFGILATAIISIISSFYHEAMQFAIKKYHCNANRK